MKTNFLDLVKQCEEVRKLAHEEHVSGFLESDFVLYDVPRFITWKQKLLLELEKIRSKDSFINNTIKIVESFDGYDDKLMFNELVGALTAIADNLDYYYGEDVGVCVQEKKKMIFISHSTKDKEYIAAFIELLEILGLHEDEIVCSSIPPYCIPLNGRVYEWLVDKFQNYNLHVIYMLSHNYYGSAASLNEMGAAWAMKQKWSAILLPGFGFNEVAGCIDPTQIGIKLDDSDLATLKFRLEELKDMLTSEFNLRNMSSALWERRRDDFLTKIEAIKSEQKGDVVIEEKTNGSEERSNRITMDACILLAYASDDLNGQILKCSYLSGTSISTNKTEKLEIEKKCLTYSKPWFIIKTTENQ